MPVVQHKDLPQNQIHANKIDPTTNTELTPASLAILDARYTAAGGTFIPVTSEVPAGSLNGTNTVFTLTFTPTAGTTRVFLNGLRLKPGSGNDYTAATNTLTFSEAPLAGDQILVDYFR